MEIWNVLSALTFIVTLTLVVTQAEFCPYQECDCTHDFIDCSKRNLSSMPNLTVASGLPQTNLDISDNNITRLTAADLPVGLVELRSLGNPLTDISSDVFTNCKDTLRSIIIEYSSLSLDDLSTALSSLTHLETVSLGHNNILHLHHLVFPDTVSHIFLDDNVMTSLPDVSYLTRLQELDVSFNNLNTLDNVTLPSSLTDLYIENNNISTLPALHFPNDSSSLVMLNINNNPLTQVDQDAFVNSPGLSHVDMAGTDLTRLPLALSKLPQLAQLILIDNKRLVCTCAESELMTWYHDVKSAGYEGYIEGDCSSGSIMFFLEELAPQCSK